MMKVEWKLTYCCLDNYFNIYKQGHLLNNEIKLNKDENMKNMPMGFDGKSN